MRLLVDAKQLVFHLVLGTLRNWQLADQRRVRLQKALVLFFLLVEVLVFTHSGLAAQVLKLTFILFLLLFHVKLLLDNVVLMDLVRVLVMLELLFQFLNLLVRFGIVFIQTGHFFFILLLLACLLIWRLVRRSLSFKWWLATFELIFAPFEPSKLILFLSQLVYLFL